MSIIEHDFGKKNRQIVRRFTTLLSLDALHEANVKANPLPYLERASERIFQLEKTLFEAAAAAEGPAAPRSSPDTIVIDKAEYHRLLNCRAIIEDALTHMELREDI
ncbi:hypothetical protein QEV83_10880 [Methylocapsa sp. D3K7]|uniref:hypothetical protein n=1 Tax=Methylocapsa sp. D3K7 TaxID=3041435 RepID=UPI00244ECAF9|nr:hypothetical protein [Methylocapsa sp. D3K7]WGJ13221.1 hypothetical protein QEV83_10880 [Methylocapsa sp. D3K7]